MKSGILLLFLGMAAILFAAVGFPAYLFWHFHSLGMDEGGVFHEAEKQFLAPGQVVVHLEEPGDHMLWLHYQASFEGEEYHFPKEIPPNLEVEMKKTETGQKADWMHLGAEMDFTVEVSDLGRKSVGVFKVETSGEYQLEISGDFEPRVFAIATAPMDHLFGRIGTLFVVAIVVGLSGLGLVIFGIVLLIRGNR